MTVRSKTALHEKKISDQYQKGVKRRASWTPDTRGRTFQAGRTASKSTESEMCLHVLGTAPQKWGEKEGLGNKVRCVEATLWGLTGHCHLVQVIRETTGGL